MTTIFESGAAGAGTHALIIGVGNYPGIEGFALGPAAATSIHLASWLELTYHNPDAPLASLEMLVSGAGGAGVSYVSHRRREHFELEAPALEPARFAARSWMERASSHEDNITLFYFIGRGSGSGRDVLLLPDDPARTGESAKSSFKRLLSLRNIVESMRGCAARRQVYVVETAWKGPSPPNGPTVALLEDYSTVAPGTRHMILHSAFREGFPYAFSRQASPFSRAFTGALEGLAARPGAGAADTVRLVDFLVEEMGPLWRESAELDLPDPPEAIDLHFPQAGSAAQTTATPEPVATPPGQPTPAPPPGPDAPGGTAPPPAPLETDEEKPAEPNMDFVLDDAELEHDELGRAVLAISLARRLHRIWTKTVQRKAGEAQGAFVVHIDAPWGGGKTTFANFLARVLNPCPADAPPARFLRDRYPQAGLGGIFLDDPPPDEAAAARLAALPEEARRPWVVVWFNAWQAEHIAPPWWIFYQTIRKRCFDALLAEGDEPWRPPAPYRRPRAVGRGNKRWLRVGRLLLARGLRPVRRVAGRWRDRADRFDRWLGHWEREYRWRLANPKVRSLLVTALVTGALLFGLHEADIVAVDSEGALGFNLDTAVGLLFAGITGVTALWGLAALFTESIVPGTDTLAERLSLGSGDPFERFRVHFYRTMARIRRPVMVIVDDLDRCKPDFVVGLVRGIQTLLRSPRVVFVILGDRDWIERAFEAHHHAMHKVDVGAEQTFGARFVEKAIQMSFILPALSPDTQRGYVRRVLLGADAGAAGGTAPLDTATATTLREVANRESEAPGASPFDADEILKKTLGRLREMRGADAPEDEAVRGQVEQLVGDTLAIKVAGDERVEREVSHDLEPLAAYFPANPRQIKRVVNAVTIYYSVALQRQGLKVDADFRSQLALWVIIMTEWPQTWRLLASFPELAAILTREDPAATIRDPSTRLPGSPAATARAIAPILADKELMALIKGSGPVSHPPLDPERVVTLAELTPLHSRRHRLDEPDSPAPALRPARPSRWQRPRNGGRVTAPPSS